MKITLLVSFIYMFSIFNVFSKDVRNITLGVKVQEIDTRGYTNFVCHENNKLIDSWNNFNECSKNSDDYYLVRFEYDERFAINENYEGTQIAGHPVIIYLAIDQNSIIQEINAHTDPSAPFYFKKQAHLLYLRVYAKYGSNGWQCENKPKKDDHTKIGKDYINRVCVKKDNKKLIKLETKFYFKNNKKDRKNLVSNSKLQLKIQSSI
jgi:hypothetical protein